MMEFSYAFMDPTGNMTALVETAVPVEDQPRVAAAIMAAEPTCEQVGFVVDAPDGCDAAIRMAGGEVCGNAAMCAASLYALNCGMEEEKALRVSVSGREVEIVVTPAADGYACSVAMPAPKEIITVEKGGLTLPVVLSDGISHAVLIGAVEDSTAETIVRELCEELRAEALGLMQVDLEASTMKPLVYVPEAKTMFWENSCGSGTAAVGAYLRYSTGKALSLPLRQKGGTLHVAADEAGNITLQGTARLLRRNTITIA